MPRRPTLRAGCSSSASSTVKGFELIYYCEGQDRGARTSRFQTASTDDPMMGDVLEAALGISAIVRKRRELWRKDNVVFNLDTVEGVGQILEVEVQAQGRLRHKPPDHQVPTPIPAMPRREHHRLQRGPGCRR